MFSNTEFNHLKLKLDQLYLSLSGGKVNGETVFSKKVTFGSGDKAIKIYDGKIEGLDSPGGHTYDLELDGTQLTLTEDSEDKTTVQIPSTVVGACTTAAATAAKVVTLTDVTDFELTKGTVIVVKFTNSNTAQNPTLNVNGTGAKSVYYNTSVVSTGSLWAAGTANRYIEYMYDGTNWVWISQGADNNTTYSAMSKSELTTGTATTSRVVRADYLHNGIKQIAESSDVDTADNITTFTSSDTTDANANAWTSVTKLSSGEDHKSIFAKMSQMFKNVRYLYKMLGTTDISTIGGGTVTGGLYTLNSDLANLYTMSSGTDVHGIISAVVNNTVWVWIPYKLPNNTTYSITYNIYWGGTGTTTAITDGVDAKGSLLKFTNSVFVANPGKALKMTITY